MSKGRNSNEMKICNVCKEVEAVSGGRCKECKNAISLGISPSNINHKWRVAIQVCDNGHSYVPVEGRCLECARKRNYEETKEVLSVWGSSEESGIQRRWLL